MLEAVSRHIASAIKKADPTGPASIDVMTYVISIRLNLYLTILFTMLGGLMTGHIIGSMFALGVLMISRKLTGGRHFSSLTICLLFTSSLCIIAPLISLALATNIAINIVAFVIFYIHAPSYFTSHEHEIRKNNTTYRLIICFIVAINIVFLSPILTIIFLIQSLSILPGGERS